MILTEYEQAIINNMRYSSIRTVTASELCKDLSDEDFFDFYAVLRENR